MNKPSEKEDGPGKLTNPLTQANPLTQEQAPENLEASVPRGVMRVSSKQLFGRAEEVEIDHNGTPYRLRQTSLGKLILTK